jgi:hypothetical protein
MTRGQHIVFTFIAHQKNCAFRGIREFGVPGFEYQRLDRERKAIDRMLWDRHFYDA